MKTELVNGYIVKIGGNAAENWFLLKKAKRNYWFFHLAAFPSCFVIWEYEGDDVKKSVLQQVAQICVKNTKHRNAKNIKVDCTQCYNIEKGKIVGEIYYKSNKKVITVVA